MIIQFSDELMTFNPMKMFNLVERYESEVFEFMFSRCVFDANKNETNELFNGA